MRQDHRVGFGMQQIKSSAERVAKLVMNRHPDRAEAASAQPGAIERFGTGFDVGGVVFDFWQRLRQASDAFLRHQ